ncbi:MAG: hypothetical protein JKY70_11325 [Mucilaginibacter sp.]|nr:hypothetical protein [Mucilaginibacter sp.]
MNHHQGQTIEYIVRKNSFSISNLALQLGVNRRTLYNYFGSATIKPSVILQIGGILRHDFSKEFPHMFQSQEFETTINAVPKFSLMANSSPDDELYKEKYVALLEKYNSLLLDLVN